MTSANYSSVLGLATAIYSHSMPGPDVTPPKIQNIKFNSVTIQNGDYVNGKVVITANITDESGIDTLNTTVEMDSAITPFVYLTAPSTYDAITGNLSFTPAQLGEGTHTFAIFARDLAGNTAQSSTYSFKIQGGDLKMDGQVINYPNPFAPPGQTTKISYFLNQNADIKVYIFNMIGQSVKKFECPQGTEGGHAGYNQVTWDGISDFNEVLPNDVYFCKVVSGGKVLGKCKIAILK